MLGKAPQTKETLTYFCENMDPDKWDTSVVSDHPKFTGIPQVEVLSTGPSDLGCHRAELGIDIQPFFVIYQARNEKVVGKDYQIQLF